MKWSRELKIARRSLRTVVRAASAMAKAQIPLPILTVGRTTLTAVRTPVGTVETADFGSNPGRLAMFVQSPSGPVPPNAPLVVLLHGCGESAVNFVRTTGWAELADELRLPLILPEQSGDNNHGRCFNWFRPAHTGRGVGEALPIRQMVAAATQHFGSDPRRVFVSGLSAGGAMAAAMLAAYPDVFAAGAVVAGLPVGAASSTAEALARMAEAGPASSPTAWAKRVQNAAPNGYAGAWPRVSIWAGEADRVVDPANANLLVAQWSTLHGLEPAIPTSVEFPGARRDRWGPIGRPAVELWTLPGEAHVWPAIATREIASFWGLRRD